MIAFRVIGLIALAAIVARAMVRKITVFEFQRALLYRKGRFVRVLEPGVHYVPALNTRVDEVDVRPAYVTIPGQELLSADGVTLKASVAARFEIVDLDVAINKVDAYVVAFYLTIQIALRDVVGRAKIDELLADRTRFNEQLIELAAAPVAELGLRLIRADIKDIMFPGELKRIFAQVVEARQAGLAALEKARGETAALRNLANAARLVEGNPALLQLRVLEAIAAQPGNTLVLGVPGMTLVPGATGAE